MSLLSSFLLFILFLRSIPVSFTHSAPRTVRPYLSGPPRSLIRRGMGETQLAQTSGVGHQNSSSWFASGTGTLFNGSTQANQSSTEQQLASETPSTSKSLFDAVCGTRTRNMYADEKSAYFDFPDFCLLWDETCSGNYSHAKGMYPGKPFRPFFTLTVFLQCEIFGLVCVLDIP